MNFISKTNTQVDLATVQKELDDLLKQNPWPEERFDIGAPGDQISVTHRPGAEDIWTDGEGSLYNPQTKTFIAKESDFSEYNPYLGKYTKKMIEQLASDEGTAFGRIRFMKAKSKRGLSIHRDLEPRYHLVIQTNPGALFGEYHGIDGVAATCYHLPANGYFYKVDTTREHFIYNGGWEDRIHLVLAEVKDV